MGELDETPAVPGKQLKLTVDIDLQIAAEEALAGQERRHVAMDPRTGEILAMVSRPTFDPNDFAVRISRDEWNKLVNDPDKPLLNKAIQAQLAPGSTFKIIMSVAGWQEDIAQTLNVHCNGGATFYGRRFGCWVKGGARRQSTSPRRSTSPATSSSIRWRKNWASTASRSTPPRSAWVRRPESTCRKEVSGVMPSEEWKIRNFKQKWYAGETISVGIGQGAVATTPVQLMRAISAISMDGRMVVPHVANPTGSAARRASTSQRYTEVKNYSDRSSTGYTIITDAMARVLLPGGHGALGAHSGHRHRRQDRIAQIVSLALQREARRTTTTSRRTAGSSDSRRAAIRKSSSACLFEGGEHGKLAARLATQVIKAYVDKQRRQPTKMAKDGAKVDVGALWTRSRRGRQRKQRHRRRPLRGRSLKEEAAARRGSTGLAMNWLIAGSSWLVAMQGAAICHRTNQLKDQRRADDRRLKTDD